MIVLITGPSGAGKSSFIAELMAAEVTSLAHRRGYKTFKARAIAADAMGADRAHLEAIKEMLG